MTAHNSPVNRRLVNTDSYTRNEPLPVIYGYTIGKRIVDGYHCADNLNRSFQQRDVHPFFRRPDLSIEFIGIDSDSYTPRLELIDPDGSRTGKTRQFVKVRVRNSGGIIARNCRAKLRVARNISMRSWPSDNIYGATFDEIADYIDENYVLMNMS